MNDMTSGGTEPAGNRLDTVEAILSRYPHIEEGELRDLKHWWRREASAFDVASLASREALRDQYAQFRTDHVDRFSGRDVILGLVGASMVSAIVVGIYLAA